MRGAARRQGRRHAVKKLLDPFLIVGILLIGLNHWTGNWMTYHPQSDPRRGVVLAVDWISGIGGFAGIVIGVIRPVVRLALERRFLLAGSFYAAFWLLLASPLLFAAMSREDTAPGSALWFGFLLILFPVMGVLLVVSYGVVRYLQHRRSG
jgi:hypothetical protein